MLIKNNPVTEEKMLCDSTHVEIETTQAHEARSRIIMMRGPGDTETWKSWSKCTVSIIQDSQILKIYSIL